MADCALVTGASSGIGAACARRLLRAGWRVALCARRSQPLAALAADFPTQTLVVAADLTAAAELERLARAVAEWTPALDAAIFAAGDFFMAPMTATSSADFERLWRLTVWSRFELVRALLPRLAAGTRPRALVHIASLAAHHDFPNETAYLSAMHGLVGLARAQDAELRPQGIRVSLLSPGTVRTPLTQRHMAPAALAGALEPEAIAASAGHLIAVIQAGGYIPEILHLPQNST
ncbi:MAG TPA: SDR family oxidoreductase [Terriglobales bacterium]|nr:SDR family oxidoreductase [Terriglobales bacterium]